MKCKSDYSVLLGGFTCFPHCYPDIFIHIPYRQSITINLYQIKISFDINKAETLSPIYKLIRHLSILQFSIFNEDYINYIRAEKINEMKIYEIHCRPMLVVLQILEQSQKFLKFKGTRKTNFSSSIKNHISRSTKVSSRNKIPSTKLPRNQHDTKINLTICIRRKRSINI